MATLKGIFGDSKGMVFELTKDETTIGRHGANMLVISDVSVSSFHCSIAKDGGKFMLRDLDSTNGTRVNGEPVKMRRISSGNILQIGNVELLFEVAFRFTDCRRKSAQECLCVLDFLANCLH